MADYAYCNFLIPRHVVEACTPDLMKRLVAAFEGDITMDLITQALAGKATWNAADKIAYGGSWLNLQVAESDGGGEDTADALSAANIPFIYTWEAGDTFMAGAGACDGSTRKEINTSSSGAPIVTLDKHCEPDAKQVATVRAYLSIKESVIASARIQRKSA